MSDAPQIWHYGLMFGDVTVHGAYTDAAATATDTFLVVVARKDGLARG